MAAGKQHIHDSGELTPFESRPVTMTEEPAEPLVTEFSESEFEETMNSSLTRFSSDEDISSPDISALDSSSEEESYQTASEESRHRRRGQVPSRTTNYSTTKNKQSSVKKDKKTVVQNNINIGTLIGNLHIGPSFSASASDHLTVPSSGRRASSADRHLESCLSSDRIVEDSELESIANAIGSSWKEVGKRLRIDPDHLDYLERQNSSTIKNRNASYRMLFLWAQKFDQRATVRRLAKAICKAGEIDAIKSIRS